MQAEQEQGFFPRLNAKLLSSRSYGNTIVSVVGQITSNDGQTVVLRCTDGGEVTIIIDPSFVAPSTQYLEIVGAVNADNTVQVRQKDNIHATNLDVSSKI